MSKKAAENVQDSVETQDEVITTPAAKVVPAEVVTTEKTEIFVYVGPNLPNGLLNMSSVIKGTRAEVLKHLEPITAKYPEVPSLLVAVEQLADARARIRKGGNLMAANYEKLVAAIRKK